MYILTKQSREEKWLNEANLWYSAIGIKRNLLRVCKKLVGFEFSEYWGDGIAWVLFVVGPKLPME